MKKVFIVGGAILCLVLGVTLISSRLVQQTGVVNLVDGRQCYAYSHEATSLEPYEVSESMDITITGDKVIGTKGGTQKGPDMNNGYTGTLAGTLDKNVLTLIFSYTIEGSKNVEKELYRASKTGIEKMRYPLVEQDKMLVPDMTKDFKILQYSRVGCIASN